MPFLTRFFLGWEGFPLLKSTAAKKGTVILTFFIGGPGQASFSDPLTGLIGDSPHAYGCRCHFQDSRNTLHEGSSDQGGKHLQAILSLRQYLTTDAQYIRLQGPLT